jgi:hypothetical protein
LKIHRREIVWTFIGNRMDFEFLIIHNIKLYIIPYYGYIIKIVWINYGFSGAIANFILWISHFFRCMLLIATNQPFDLTIQPWAFGTLVCPRQFIN